MRLKFDVVLIYDQREIKNITINPAVIRSKLKAQSYFIIQQNPTESAYI